MIGDRMVDSAVAPLRGHRAVWVLPFPVMDGEEYTRPNVVPIDGWTLPPPPDWRLTDESRHLKRLAEGVISPEDLTIRGKPRCVSTSRRTGLRCGNEAVLGTTVCKFHGAGKPRHPDDPRPDTPATKARAQLMDEVRQHLEFAAQSAVMAVQSIVEDELAKPTERLKAAEIILDRTVGRQIQLEREDQVERDLDKEILAIAESLEDTGTDGPSSAT